MSIIANMLLLFLMQYKISEMATKNGDDMNIRFTTPCIYNKNCSNEYGCASYGFSGAPDPSEKNERVLDNGISGKAFFGTLEEVLAHIPAFCIRDGKELPWQAGIVLFGNCGGENAFIRDLYEKVRCPLTGGAAACNTDTGESGLIAGASQAAVYMICDPEKNIHVESRNIHGNLLGIHKIGFTDPRVLDTIDGEDAVEWYTKKRAEYGFTASDFEHMTFSDLNGINAHMSMDGDKLVSGRDLCEEMMLRYVEKGDVYPQMEAFYNDSDALIFGCAGLKGILEENIMLDTMGMFMFGEVATINNVPEFGNLMLSKLCYETR